MKNLKSFSIPFGLSAIENIINALIAGETSERTENGGDFVVFLSDTLARPHREESYENT